jgi:Protein of unknown function (DUF2877)
MVALPAHLVATPVLELLRGAGQRTEQGHGGARGVVLGAGASAAWVDVGGFVVAITTREVPLLPNAVGLGAGSGALARPGVVPGAPARVAPGRVDLGALQVTWDPAAPPAWDPTVPVPTTAGPGLVARRGAALRGALGAVDSRGNPSPGCATLPLRGASQPEVGVGAARDLDPVGVGAARDLDPVALVRELAGVGLATATDPEGAVALGVVFRGVAERDPEPVSRGARGLLGRGPGLTPEGDDLLAGVAGTLAVLGPVTGVGGPALTALLAALEPAPGRTTALSATLLRLAARRRLAEPAGRLLAFGPDAEAAWPGALARLERLGHGSGRAYAAGIAATASLLAAT